MRKWWEQSLQTGRSGHSRHWGLSSEAPCPTSETVARDTPVCGHNFVQKCTNSCTKKICEKTRFSEKIFWTDLGKFRANFRGGKTSPRVLTFRP